MTMYSGDEFYCDDITSGPDDTEEVESDVELDEEEDEEEDTDDFDDDDDDEEEAELTDEDLIDDAEKKE